MVTALLAIRRYRPDLEPEADPAAGAAGAAGDVTAAGESNGAGDGDGAAAEPTEPPSRRGGAGPTPSETKGS